MPTSVLIRLGAVGVGFELLSQMRDVDPKILRLALGLLSPNCSEQLPMGHNFSGVLHEHAEEANIRSASV